MEECSVEVDEVDPKLNFWGVDFDEMNCNSFKQEKEIKNILNDEEKTKNHHVPVSSRDSHDKVNEVLEERIENIRIKYLVGKKVGEDLLDAGGIVIATKNSLITEDLINIVDKQGKLSELILNMIFPEKSE